MNRIADSWNRASTTIIPGLYAAVSTCIHLNAQSVTASCEKCSKALESFDRAVSTGTASQTDKDKKIRELELELAQTKLALVQIECRCQEMRHELNGKTQELQVKPHHCYCILLTV